ncbi:uncharacterized protein LOC131213476 [Anopheles bellator]|uniref:uncharacterized protein LOC131213476 n=1 Tax=Anopheles bellator TaxID=139047 RepID=UPI002647AC0F|nr:uncharacterized protein LOC131213476 [Anopheles bellator]
MSGNNACPGCTVIVLCGVVVVLTFAAIVPEQPSVWPRWSPELSKLLELVFAAVDRIDVVNSTTDTTNDPALGALLRYRTVRWYTADPMPSECADGNKLGEDLGDERAKRMQWLWNQNSHDGGGYLIYGDLSALLGRYVCLFDPAATYLLSGGVADAGLERPQLLSALRLIWTKRGAFRVFVHLRDAILTYNPFVKSRANNGDGCVSNFGALVEVSASEPLPHVPWNDFGGYPVKVEVFRSVYSNPVKGSTGSYRGADITARDVFQHHLNVTVIHVPADSDLFGDRLPNGTFTGAIGRVLRHQADIVFTGFFIKDYLARDLAFSASLYSDAVCCLVRKASRIPEYLLPLFIFPADIWAMLCLLGIVCSLTWIALRATVRRSLPAQYERRFWSRRYRFAVLFNLPRTLRDASGRRQALQLVIDTFILLLSAPYRRFTRAGTERFFLTGLLLVSLIFVSLYQSGLAAVFVHPLYRRDIGSLAQLDDSGMAIPVKYRGFIDDVFPVNYSRLMDSLRGRMVHLQVQESMLTRVARLGNIATVTRKTSLALDNAVYMTTRQLHMIPECPRMYNLAYVMHRHSVFGECFNRVLLRMVGGGLINHWIDQMRYEWTLHNRRVVQNMMVSDFKVLTVLDMQFAFYVLAIGLSFAVGVIAGEVLYGRALQREHRLRNRRK